MIQNILNRILTLNPYYLQYLEGVAGLSIAVKVSDFPFKLTLVFHHSFIEVLPYSTDANLCLAGASIDFICFATQAEKRQKLLQAGRITFEGDLLVLQKIETFLNHFDLKFLSVLPVRKVKRLFENQREYWQEEKQLLVSPILFDHFKDEVLRLQQELERLEARVQCLN